jgi:predicted nucleic acid-binding protein
MAHRGGNNFQQIAAVRRPFVTNSYILLECGNAAARRPYRQEVNPLRLLLEQSGRLFFPNSLDWQLAWTAYERREAAQAGIVDHISFQIMKREGIIDAFTNDKHYQCRRLCDIILVELIAIPRHLLPLAGYCLLPVACYMLSPANYPLCII